MKQNKREERLILEHNIRSERNKKNLGMPNNYDELVAKLPVKKPRVYKSKPKPITIPEPKVKKYKKRKPNYRINRIKNRSLKEVAFDLTICRNKIKEIEDRVKPENETRTLDEIILSNDFPRLKFLKTELYHLNRERRCIIADKPYTLPKNYKYEPKPKKPAKPKKEPIYTQLVPDPNFVPFVSPYNSVPQRNKKGKGVKYEEYIGPAPVINPMTPPDILVKLKKLDKKLIHGKALPTLEEHDRLVHEYNELKEMYKFLVETENA